MWCAPRPSFITAAHILFFWRPPTLAAILGHIAQSAVVHIQDDGRLAFCGLIPILIKRPAE